MRLAALLGCLTVLALHPALAADPPAAPATSTKDASAAVQAPAAAPTTDSAPAAATAPAATPANADSDEAQLEKRLHAKGYAMHMQNGEKVFCRREEVLGSRLGGALHCMTADEARANEERARLDAERMQRVVAPCLATGSRGVNCGG